jgi:glutaredoxin
MKIDVYGKKGCEWCWKAVEFLEAASLEYTYIDIAEPGVIEMLKQTERWNRKVPAIFINDEYIGGYTELIQKAKGE